MEQQMALFVEDVATGESYQAAALPLTDALMETFFPEESEDSTPWFDIEQLLELAKAYGEKMGALAYLDGKLTEAAMDSAIIGFVDGIHSVRRLDAEEREQLRNSAFVAAFQASQRPQLPDAD